MPTLVQRLPAPSDTHTTAWYAAYVKHQHENKIATALERKGVEIFLPRRKITRRWADRNKTLMSPVFPGYIFVNLKLEDKFQVLGVQGVFFLVENAGRACVISPNEIDSIRRITEVGVETHSHPFVDSGDAVRIKTGPLSGITGILERFKNRCGVVITVKALQKALSIEVELDNLERLAEVQDLNVPRGRSFQNVRPGQFRSASTTDMRGK